MKLKILLLSLLILAVSIASIGQSSRGSKKRTEIGFKNDVDFNVTTIPDKWKDESAIILCQKYDFSYLRNAINRVSYREVFRKRVYLNDKKSIEDFSVFYFIDRNGVKGKIGFRVEKADGKRVNVNLNNAVEVGANEVSLAYKSYFLYKDKYKKIAIPNLEVGDIIDYYVYGSFSTDGTQDVRYPKFSFSLASNYPILKQKFYFNVDTGFKVNVRSFNGAPDITKGSRPGVNSSGKTKNRVKTYVIEDEDRDKLNSEIWKYNSLTEPWIKFQVIYSVGKTAKNSASLIFLDKDLVNSPISIEDIKHRSTRGNASNADFVAINKYVKRYGNNLSNIEKADLAYYYYRYQYFLYRSNSYSYEFDYKGGEYSNISFIDFSYNFRKVLQSCKIPFKYVVAVDRNVGGFDNVIFASDFTSGFKVDDKYYFFFSNVSTPDMIPTFVQGSDAIEFYTDRKKKDIKYKSSKIPSVSYKDNAIYSKLIVSFDKSMESCTIINRDSLVGYKKGAFDDLVLYKTDYLDNDEKYFKDFENKKGNGNYNTPKNSKKAKQSKKEKLKEEEENRAKAQELSVLKKWQSDFIIDFYKEDYKINKVESFKIVSSGRLPSNPSCVVKQVFKVDELIGKAGSNFIFNIGSLIGGQLELSPEDMERINDIDISQQASYNYDIIINIPEGYYVESVDALNYNVINEMGEFTVKAIIEGDIIKLTTSKKYKTIHSSKENWKDYVAFLEAAFEFSQKKIIIKKK